MTKKTWEQEDGMNGLAADFSQLHVGYFGKTGAREHLRGKLKNVRSIIQRGAFLMMEGAENGFYSSIT